MSSLSRRVVDSSLASLGSVRLDFRRLSVYHGVTLGPHRSGRVENNHAAVDERVEEFPLRESNDALTLWERGEGILMAANLIGSVTVGFGAVVVGTAWPAGWLSPQASEARPALAGVEANAVEHSHSARTEGGHSTSAAVEIVDGVSGHRVTNEGSQ